MLSRTSPFKAENHSLNTIRSLMQSTNIFGTLLPAGIKPTAGDTEEDKDKAPSLGAYVLVEEKGNKQNLHCEVVISVIKKKKVGRETENEGGGLL